MKLTSPSVPGLIQVATGVFLSIFKKKYYGSCSEIGAFAWETTHSTEHYAFIVMSRA